MKLLFLFERPDSIKVKNTLEEPSEVFLPKSQILVDGEYGDAFDYDMLIMGDEIDVSVPEWLIQKIGWSYD